MKILIVSQYYSPEPGATSNRLESFAKAMVRRGHDVTVICEFPNHPRGILRREDRWRLYRKENVSGRYRILRTWVLAFPKKNNLKRVLFYLSFAISSLLAGLVSQRHDVVFTSSPPIFHALTAMLIARLKKAKFILDIRDLWPDSVVEFKAMPKGVLIRWAGLLEHMLYRSAATIFAVSEGLKEKIEARGGKEKVNIAYNGSEEAISGWQGDVRDFRERQNWSGKTVIMYAGLMGLGQNLSALIPLLKRNIRDDILFYFKGDGPQKAEFQRSISQSGLKNVIVEDAVPFNEIIPYMYGSDIMLVILRDSPFFRSAIPSKFFDYMASGKPILTNVDGELREIMEQNKTGVYFSLSEPESFDQALKTLSDPAKAREYGENGKRIVMKKFMRSNIADKVVTIIENEFKDNE